VRESDLYQIRLRDHLAEFHGRRGGPDPGRWHWTLARLIKHHKRLHRRNRSHWHPKRWWGRDLVAAAAGAGGLLGGLDANPVQSFNPSLRLLDVALGGGALLGGGHRADRTPTPAKFGDVRYGAVR
jgi:hypothetical protein